MKNVILASLIFLIVSCNGDGSSTTNEVTVDAEVSGTVDFAIIPDSFTGIEIEITLATGQCYLHSTH